MCCAVALTGMTDKTCVPCILIRSLICFLVGCSFLCATSTRCASYWCWALVLAVPVGGVMGSLQ